MAHKDPEAKKRYMRERYQRKSEEIKQYQREYRQNKKEKSQKACRMAALKLKMSLMAQRGGECQHCGFSHPAALDFHHRDPKDKSFTVGYQSYTNRDALALFAEVEKCDLLCANCHRIEHSEITENDIDDVVMGRDNYQRKLTDPEIVRSLYWDGGLSMTEIGKELGVHSSTVHAFMRKHDIPSRPSARWPEAGMVQAAADLWNDVP